MNKIDRDMNTLGFFQVIIFVLVIILSIAVLVHVSSKDAHGQTLPYQPPDSSYSVVSAKSAWNAMQGYYDKKNTLPTIMWSIVRRHPRVYAMNYIDANQPKHWVVYQLHIKGSIVLTPLSNFIVNGEPSSGWMLTRDRGRNVYFSNQTIELSPNAGFDGSPKVDGKGSYVAVYCRYSREIEKINSFSVIGIDKGVSP